MMRHFTTSIYILHEEKVLLLFHPKLKKWLPPGGHVEENETPPMAAHREVMEETGLKIEIVRQENVWVERWNAKSFERPWMCLLEEIPEHQGTPAHQHIDMIYIAKPVGNIDPISPDPIQWFALDEIENPIQWFALDEIENLKSDEEIFAETQEVIGHLLREEVSYR